MTDTDGLSLLSRLSDFLADPVIKIQHSDEVVSLQVELADLQNRYDDLMQQYEKLAALYRQEVTRCLHMQDLCRENGIKWR